jgi:hypothetical protein
MPTFPATSNFPNFPTKPNLPNFPTMPNFPSISNLKPATLIQPTFTKLPTAS